jgi:hypothetical protein
MAIDITGNPWKIPYGDASATPVFTGKVWVNRMVWHEPTTSGHTLLVQDVAGRDVWPKTALAGGAGLDYEEKVSDIISGLVVPTMDSGTLYVYLDQTP